MTETKEYEDFVLAIMNRMHIVKTKQLVNCISNYYDGITKKTAAFILMTMQSRFVIFNTTDGYTVDKETYKAISGDKFMDNVDRKSPQAVELEVEPLLTPTQKELIDDFWIIADYMPSSEEFIVCYPPFMITFTTDGIENLSDEDFENGNMEKATGVLYEIARLTTQSEDARSLQIKYISKYSRKFRDAISRIAVIDKEDHARFVPYLGFTRICVLDPSEDSGYRLVQVRSDDEKWKDYVEE